MKRLLLIPLLFFACVLSSYAQDVKVLVTSAVEPLGFSYIYINRKPFGSVGNDGVTFIPASRLHRGDTISASFVGYNNGMVIYDGPRAEGYKVMLTSNGQMEKIEIHTRRESRREFHRTIIHRPILSSTANFESNFIFVDNKTDKGFRGKLFHYFKTDLDKYVYGGINEEKEAMQREADEKKRKGLKDTTEKNTYLDLPRIEEGCIYTGGTYNKVYVELPPEYDSVLKNKVSKKFIQQTAMPLLKDAFYAASRNVVCDEDYLSESFTAIRLTGTKDNRRTFLLTREANGKSSDGVQSSMVTLSVDASTHEIMHAYMELTKKTGRVELQAYYRTYKNFRFPYKLEAIFSMPDGNQYYMEIYNTFINYYTRPHMFKRSNSTNISCIDFDIVDPAGIEIIHKGPAASATYKSLINRLYGKTVVMEDIWEFLERMAALNALQ